MGDRPPVGDERIDGGGYPDGLSGEEIPLEARVITTADAYCVMTSERPYDDVRSAKDALNEIWRCAGTQFDRAVVQALTAVLEEPPAPAQPRGEGALWDNPHRTYVSRYEGTKTCLQCHDAQARAALSRYQETSTTGAPLAKWPVTSPVAGVVLRVMQKSEGAVALGAPLLEVADPRSLEAVVDVLSQEAVGVRPCTTCRPATDPSVRCST